MIIIPHTGKMSWANPPVITLLLILTNCLVFFAWQGNDASWYQQAQDYYFSSGLAKVEQEAYLRYLEDTGQDRQLQLLRESGADDAESEYTGFMAMQNDRPFMAKLKNGEIITPQTKGYAEWQQRHQEYEGILDRSITHRYGYIPARGNILHTVTSMFLHGGLMHLVGNMVFLWLVGCMIEMGCSRPVYGATYLLTGIVAVLFFGLVYRDSYSPLIGASGAIAGLMGFYTVLFFHRKVGVFLSLGFYFTNTRVPAIALLPFWIGNELYQLFLGGPSNVAYVAHVGGLVSGALVGAGHKIFLGGVRETASGEEHEDAVAVHMEEGLRRMAALDFAGARQSMEQVLQLDPDNTKALLHLFRIEKQIPGRERLHEAADRLLSSLTLLPDAEEECVAVYKEYREAAGLPALSVETFTKISRTLLKKGELEETAAILAYLLKSHARLPQLPGSLLGLARAYHDRGVAAKACKCLQILCRTFPESAEYRQASSLLARYSTAA